MPGAVGHHGQPEGVVLPTRVQGPCHVVEGEVAGAEHQREPLAHRVQVGLGASRDADQPGRAVLGRARQRGRLLDHAVRVDPAEAEGADAGPSGAGGPPRPQRGHHVEVGAGQVHLRRDLPEVQGRVQFRVPHAEDRLDQTGDAGRVVEVAEVGLQGADRKGAAPPPAREGQALHLDGVAQPGAGAVGLQVAGRGEIEAGPLPGAVDDVGLGAGAGGGDGGGVAAVVRGGGAPDHRVHVRALVQGAFEGGEEQDRAALSGARAVRLRVEGAGAGGGRGDAGEVADGCRRSDGVAQAHAADDRVLRLPVPEFAAGLVDGDERAVAAGVDAVAGPGEGEAVGDAGGEREGHVAHETEGAGFADERQVSVAGRAEHHGRPAVAQRRGGVPGVLQRLLGEVERQPVLRIGDLRLVAGEAESLVVEEVDPVQVAHVGIVGFRVESGGGDPLRRGGAYGVPSGTQVRAQGREVGRLRQAGRDADHRDAAGGGAGCLRLHAEHSFVTARRRPGRGGRTAVAGGRRRRCSRSVLRGRPPARRWW